MAPKIIKTNKDEKNIERSLEKNITPFNKNSIFKTKKKKSAT